MGAPHDEQSVSTAANWWPQAEHLIWMSVMSPKTYTGCSARPMTSVTKSQSCFGDGVGGKAEEALPRIDYSDTDFASFGVVQGADPRSNDQSAAVLPIIPRPSNISPQDQHKQPYPQNHWHQQQHR